MELRAEMPGSRITSLEQKFEQRMESGIAELLERQERSLLASFVAAMLLSVVLLKYFARDPH